MYRIFCITESSYIKHFDKYNVEVDFEDDKRVVNIYKSMHKPALILPGSGFIVYCSHDSIPDTTEYDPWSSKHAIFVHEAKTFFYIQELKDFVKLWFSPNFCCIYKEGQFHMDDPSRYANPDSFELPVECFEVHSINETGSIIGIAPLCDFTPSKR